MKHIIGILLSAAIAVGIHAQDKYLLKHIEVVARLQNAHESKRVYQAAVDTLAYRKYPPITLLDDIGTDSEGEYVGANDMPFRLNSVVAHAYQQQQGQESSRGNYFDSRQAGINYSLIEKCVKPGKSVRYTISEHRGKQELAFIPFNPNARFRVKVTYEQKEYAPHSATMGSTTYVLVSIGHVDKDKPIHIEIENQSAVPESFAILNYNAKKKP